MKIPESVEAAEAELAASKDGLRRRMIARRRRFRGLARERADLALTRAVLSALAPDRDGVIACFWPLPGEFDTRPLLNALADRQQRLCLPAVLGRGEALQFRRWEPGMELRRGNFGIETPPPAMPALRPDVVLTPFLAIDRTGCRLGYGGGYFDRTLAALRAEGAVTAVALGYEFQYRHRVPRAEDDQAADWLITEQAVYQFCKRGPVRRRGRGII